MKAFEFQTKLNSNQTLELPADLKAELSPGSNVRVILLISEPNEQADWARLTTEQFANGYAERDRVYDKL